MQSVVSGDEMMIRMLLDAKADVNIKMVGGTTPAMRACLKGVKEARMLIEAKADLSTPMQVGVTSL